MPQIHVNCALCDKFLQLGMKLGMVIRLSKTTTNKVGWPLVAGMHNIKNGRHSNSEISFFILINYECSGDSCYSVCHFNYFSKNKQGIEKGHILPKFLDFGYIFLPKCKELKGDIINSR